MKKILATAAVAALAVSAYAVPQFTFENAPTHGALVTAQVISTDAVEGVAPTVSSQTGNQHGFTSYAVLTNGGFGVDGTAGPGDGIITGDFPAVSGGAASPAVSLRFDFSPMPLDVDEVRVFSGHTATEDRTFHHYDLYGSTDGGSSFNLILAGIKTGNFNATAASASTGACLTVVDDSLGGSLGVYDALRLDFFSCGNTAGALVDQYDNGHPSDVDGAGSGATAGANGNVIREIDIIGITVPVELSVFEEN